MRYLYTKSARETWRCRKMKERRGDLPKRNSYENAFIPLHPHPPRCDATLCTKLFQLPLHLLDLPQKMLHVFHQVLQDSSPNSLASISLRHERRRASPIDTCLSSSTRIWLHCHRSARSIKKLIIICSRN